MTTLAKMEVTLTGTGVVGGGVSTFYVLPANVDDAVAELETFYGVVAGNSPDNVTFNVLRSGFTINDADGDVVGTWSATGSSTPFVGASSGGFQMGVGARVKWLTAGIRNDRHVTGSTFLVPLASSAYTTDGFLLSAVVSALDAAADNMVAAGIFFTLSRPTTAEPVGESNIWTAAQVPNAVSWLRSRRT